MKYQISSRADVGDKTEEMDLATGKFITMQDQEDYTYREDGPSIPNDNLNKLLQDAVDGDSAKTNDLVYDPLPPYWPLP